MIDIIYFPLQSHMLTMIIILCEYDPVISLHDCRMHRNIPVHYTKKKIMQYRWQRIY